jgi:MFS transporter, MHS family, shikimate and dehydroshikimate transport protein
MHGQSTLDALGRQPREQLNLIGTRWAEHSGLYLVVVFALAYAANQFKIPKFLIPQTVTAGVGLSLAIPRHMLVH